MISYSIILQMIDEFTDVNKGEKELMKLWNTFSMQNKYERTWNFTNTVCAWAGTGISCRS